MDTFNALHTLDTVPSRTSMADVVSREAFLFCGSERVLYPDSRLQMRRPFRCPPLCPLLEVCAFEPSDDAFFPLWIYEVCSRLTSGIGGLSADGGGGESESKGRTESNEHDWNGFASREFVV